MSHGVVFFLAFLAFGTANDEESSNPESLNPESDTEPAPSRSAASYCCCDQYKGSIYHHCSLPKTIFIDNVVPIRG